jgi:predicted lipoprotein with Yx(FWY)xxD motif
MKTHLLLVLLALAAILLAAACGGGDGSGNDAAADSDLAQVTVSVSTVDGVGEVLVDADGAALYASDVEADGTVLCTEACAEVWEPLVVSGEPAGGDGLDASLDVVARPEGTQQVTFDGRPLYSFIEDSTPGTVTGNGLSDTFADQSFTWHVATPTGISTSSANSSPTGGYEGGYGG